MITIVSTSLNPESKSRTLAREALQVLQAEGVVAELLDLRDFPLPLCDAAEAYSNSHVAAIGDRLRAASGIILATAIYNYDANAAAKNLIELTGDAWEGKAVGFLCAAGGMNSYMSILPLANSMMLDFRCIIVPRFVYATGSAFSGTQLIDQEIQRRVADLARTTADLANWRVRTNPAQQAVA